MITFKIPAVYIYVRFTVPNIVVCNPFITLFIDTEDASETDMVKREEAYTEIKEQ